MKKILSAILTICLIFSLAACNNNYAQINLKETIQIPENGIVENNVFEKLKQENAIATFTGESNSIKYDWMVFGKDINEPRAVNLLLDLNKTDNGIKIKFHEKEDFGFPALLSIHLNEKWNANSAVAYDGKDIICSVSVTGSKTTILNMSVNKTVLECEISPDNSELLEQDSSIIENASKNEMTASSNSSVGKISVSNSSSNCEKQSQSSSSCNSNTSENTSSAKSVTSVQKNPSVNENSKTNSSSDSSATKEVLQDTNSNSDTSSYTSSFEKDVSENRIYSDGQNKDTDKYETEPIPEGKPLPVEPEERQVDKKKEYTCTFSIECSTILNNLADLDPDKRELIPSNGIILAPTKVTFYEGESVFDLLQRVCKEKEIHLESSWAPVYNSAYIEGIHNLYEFDCGELSGWMYRVNGWYPNYGCSRYQLVDGETVEFRYTCDLGKDVGCEWMADQ